jgi:hypothetical protein
MTSQNENAIYLKESRKWLWKIVCRFSDVTMMITNVDKSVVFDVKVRLFDDVSFVVDTHFCRRMLITFGVVKKHVASVTKNVTNVTKNVTNVTKNVTDVKEVLF